MSKVSIIIPIYNAAKYLRETLDSVLNQSEQDWECILMNDGSTDSSIDIINEYVQRDSRFVAFTVPNNGCADLTNAIGETKVKSPFYIEFGHDDVLAPDYLEQMLKRQAETDADAVSATMIFCEHELEGEIWRLPCKPLTLETVLPGREACAHTIGGWHFAGNGMLTRLELRNGVLRGHYMNSDEFSSRQIIYKARKIAFADAKYIYRQHNESITRKKSPRLWERLFVDSQIEDFIVENYSHDESICAKAVSSTFFNLVYLAYEGYTLPIIIDRKNRKKIRESIKYNFNQLNVERMQRYLPKHYRLFVKYGYGWFCAMSVLYHISRKVRGMKPYECQ